MPVAWPGVSGNDLEFVRGTVGSLAEAGVAVWLFGGWAEELAGMTSRRPHHDLDLLYPADSFHRLDALLATDEGLSEINAKRFTHKRAFVRLGVMTELILVHCGPGPTYVTEFWGRVRYEWPADLLAAGEIAGLRVASRAALRRYRADHDLIHGPGGRDR